MLLVFPHQLLGIMLKDFPRVQTPKSFRYVLHSTIPLMLKYIAKHFQSIFLTFYLSERKLLSIYFVSIFISSPQ